MPALLLSIIRFVRLLLSGHHAVAIENAALRLQLAAFQRNRKRPILKTLDRVFWITLRHLWSGWHGSLVYVQPDTVVRWQRERFRRFWARLSKPQRWRRGRPAIPTEIRRLIERMVAANPLWRAPRIHGELTMLGILISERTVSRILRRLPRPPSQTWKTFLHNHLGQLVSMDFFTVPTISMKVLFVFFVLEHRRREVLHFGVTEHSTAAWTSQQIVEAFADRQATRYLIRDRDGIYGDDVRLRIALLGMEEVRTAPSESLAESVRRAPGRLDSTRVPEPLRDSECQASEENVVFVFPVLPRVEDSLGARQTMPVSSAGVERRQDHRDSTNRRPSSPL